MLSVSLACSRRESFDLAIAKHRGTLVDQVNAPASGLPFFSVQTLNPTWDATAPIVRMPHIELLDQNARLRDERLYDGKTTFVAFFFASCLSYCPSLVQGMKNISQAMPATPNLQFVLITVDPAEDTPEKLAAYARKFQLKRQRHSWTLLTGSRDVIFGLAKDTLASQAFQRVTPGPRNFVHSEHFYVFDGERRLRAILNGRRLEVAAEAKDVVAQLRAHGAPLAR